RPASPPSARSSTNPWNAPSGAPGFSYPSLNSTRVNVPSSPIGSPTARTVGSEADTNSTRPPLTGWLLSLYTTRPLAGYVLGRLGPQPRKADSASNAKTGRISRTG